MWTKEPKKGERKFKKVKHHGLPKRASRKKKKTSGQRDKPFFHSEIKKKEKREGHRGEASPNRDPPMLPGHKSPGPRGRELEKCGLCPNCSR